MFRGLLIAAIAAIGVMCAPGCRSGRALPTPALPAPPIVPAAAWHTIGHSHQSRPLRCTTIGAGPTRIFIIGSIHGNEPEGLLAAKQLTELPASDLSHCTLRILDDANPDGTAARTRGNARGRDLNRNWPASNFRRGASRGNQPLSEPETNALHRDIDAFDPHLIIVFHSISTGPFVNFDGPAASLAEIFADAARAVDPRWRVVPNMGYGTPGSLGSYFGVDRASPILTIEFQRGQDPESAAAAAVAGVQALLRSAELANPLAAPFIK